MSVQQVLVSGCYIVKDEEDVLAASLEALAPFVDEVVVYDTGSSDRTREIAREFGAVVVEGFWDDDFGAARNRALEHCRGRWVFSVDADEVAVGDPRAFRRGLQRSDATALSVPVTSDTWDGVAGTLSFPLVRVFLRRLCHWEGALHEQLLTGRGAPAAAAGSGVALQHSGYTTVRQHQRGKGERNLRLARRSVEESRSHGSPRVDAHLIDLGRSALMAGALEEALRAFAEVDRTVLTPVQGVVAAHNAITAAVGSGDLDAARDWLAAAAGWGETRPVLAGLEARIALAAGDPARAVDLLKGQERLSQVDGVVFRGLTFADVHVNALLKQERLEEAVDLLLWHVAGGRLSTSYAASLLVVAQLDGGVARFAEALPAALVVPCLGQLEVSDPRLVDELLEALWRRGDTRTAVLASASRSGVALPFERAFVWSLRLREAGFAEECPLRRIVTTAERDVRTRVLSGAVLVEIGETEVLPVLEPLLEQVDDGEVPALLAELRAVAPGFAAALVPA